MARKKLLRGMTLVTSPGENTKYVLVGSTGENIIWGFDVAEKKTVELDRDEILMKLRRNEWFIETPNEI